jgi:hypothetical protein
LVAPPIGRGSADQIAAWRAERLLDATLLMGNPYVRDGMASFLHSPEGSSSSHGDKLSDFLGSITRSAGYRDVLLVNARGQILMSQSGRTGVVHEETTRIIDQALSEHRALLSDLHAGPGNMQPHVDIVAPLRM